MRVLVVDDSAFMRKRISEMISSDPAFEIVGIARNGEDGVAQAIKHEPDLITLDIEMPKMDGLSALREIRIRCRAFKPAVLMCSSLTVDGSDEALKAMRIGASDVIGKDPTVVGQSNNGFRTELLAKLRAIGEHRQHCRLDTSNARTPSSVQPVMPQHTGRTIDLSRVKAVVVGSSTGGPPVLEEIFSKISSRLHVPIIVAQHMPELFTKSLANRLDLHCACNVLMATNGTILSNPGIYIAQGAKHIRPTRISAGKLMARVVETIPGAVYRPSVDLLFKTGAELFGEHLLAIQLTGMGADGAEGAAEIKKVGGQIIAQSASSCVVYGMPKAVIDNNLADQVMEPSQISDLLAGLSSEEKSRNTTPMNDNFRDRRSA